MLYHLIGSNVRKTKFTDINLINNSVGTALFENGKFKMVTITHYPKISVTAEDKENLEKRLPKLLEIADNNCMISNSIRNNVEIKIQASIQ